jgi:hypothetical protein
MKAHKTKKKSRELGRGKDSRGNRIHPLSCQLQTNSQQFPRNAWLLLLQDLPLPTGQTPSDTIALSLNSRRATGITKERQLATRSTSDNELEVSALGEIITGAQHARFEQVKGARGVAFVVENFACRVEFTGEVGTGWEPEVFVLG